MRKLGKISGIIILSISLFFTVNITLVWGFDEGGRMAQPPAVQYGGGIAGTDKYNFHRRAAQLSRIGAKNAKEEGKMEIYESYMKGYEYHKEEAEEYGRCVRNEVQRMNTKRGVLFTPGAGNQATSRTGTSNWKGLVLSPRRSKSVSRTGTSNWKGLRLLPRSSQRYGPLRRIQPSSDSIDFLVDPNAKISVQPPQADSIKQGLSDVLGVNPEEIKIINTKEAQWSNTALGYSEPGKYYADVIVPGHKIKVKVGDKEYDIHTGYGLAKVKIDDEVHTFKVAYDDDSDFTVEYKEGVKNKVQGPRFIGFSANERKEMMRKYGDGDGGYNEFKAPHGMLVYPDGSKRYVP